MWDRIVCIAGNTFLEAVRQKFFNSLLLIAVALVVSANFFQQFDFGTGELKFIADFGFGALFFFGSILAVAGTTQLFFNEIENRTALTILAKPVHKLEFLVGKWLGAQMLMLIFTAVISVLLSAILWWRASSLLQLEGNVLAVGEVLRLSDVFVFGFLQWVKFGVIGGIVLLIASFSNTNLYTIIVSFFVILICQLQYIAQDAVAKIENGVLAALVGLLSYLFPNFQLFNVADQMVFVEAAGLSNTGVLRITLYGGMYVAGLLGLAWLNFREREI